MQRPSTECGSLNRPGSERGWRPSTGVNDDGRRFLRKKHNQLTKETYTRVETSIPHRAHPRPDELFASECDLASILEGVARLGVRLVMQAALEAEVTEVLGRP